MGTYTYRLSRIASAAIVVVYRKRRWLLSQVIALVVTGVIIALLTFTNLTEHGWKWNEDEEKLWERATLLDINDFTWISNNAAICQLNESYTKNDVHIMPVLIHSARSHFTERLAIRRTWGSLPVYKKWVIRLVFLLGQADPRLASEYTEETEEDVEYTEEQLRDEQNQFGDIVIGSFIDSYDNLTYKHLMGYKWILNFCPDASLVFKTDDDIYIDIMEWLDLRINDLEQNKNARLPDLYCFKFAKGQPVRKLSSDLGKWYVPEDEWSELTYPDYCSGSGYAITVDFLRKIYSVSNDRKIFWIDDVFVTGILAELAKTKFNFQPEIRYIPWKKVEFWRDGNRKLCDNRSSPDTYGKSVVFVYRDEFFEREMVCLWNKTRTDRNRKSAV